MPVHIVGTFFFETDASQLSSLISLLAKNHTGRVFAKYAVITPEMANLLGDVKPYHTWDCATQRREQSPRTPSAI